MRMIVSGYAVVDLHAHLARHDNMPCGRPAERQPVSHLTAQLHSNSSNTAAHECVMLAHTFPQCCCIMSARNAMQHAQQHDE
jgi:hypothetical protein